MIEMFEKYTKEELIKLRDTVVSEYNQYREVIAEAYEGMKEASDKYEKINNELKLR